MKKVLMAYVRSLKNHATNTHIKDKVTIVSENGPNNVIAEYKGKRCHAIYNVFTDAYYVDDVYGVIR